MGLFNFFKKSTASSGKKNEADNFVDFNRASEIVTKLEDLGYFKFAHNEDIIELKEEVLHSLQKNYLGTIWSEHHPFNSKDYRFYQLDGETLFEQDGFTGYLKDFEHLFHLIGFSLEITNHFEEFDTVNRWLDHSITINQKDYTIFSKFPGYGWGEAAQEFADILNDQLAIQNKDERIYLANGANDGYAVVLSPAQYELLDPFLTDLYDRPLTTDRWCKVMQVNSI